MGALATPEKKAAMPTSTYPPGSVTTPGKKRCPRAPTTPPLMPPTKRAGANMPPLMPEPMTTEVARVLPTTIPIIMATESLPSMASSSQPEPPPSNSGKAIPRAAMPSPPRVMAGMKPKRSVRGQKTLYLMARKVLT
ncbi:hypothetical protein DSECCO2_433330 [anaerobic digester metagenome]